MLDPIQAAVRQQARSKPVRVSGGRGTGKSHLARSLADDAASRGHSVLLVGSSPVLDAPLPSYDRPGPLHPVLQARAAAPVEHAPPATVAPLGDAAALRASLDPEGAALAGRLHARASAILATFDLDADEIEASVHARGPDPSTLATLRLAAMDAAEVARSTWPEGASGRTLGDVADLVSGAASPPNEGHGALVLDRRADAVDQYLAGLMATSPRQPRPELDELRRALEPWAWRSNLSTVLDAHDWARRSADLYASMADLLERHGGFEAAASDPSVPPETGRTLVMLRTRFPGVPVVQAIETCRKAADMHDAQARAVEPHLAANAGRRLSSLHTGAAADPKGMPIGELAQRLRSAKHAATRLSTVLTELTDRLPPGTWDQIRDRTLEDLADATDIATENAERAEAARSLREIRDAYAATGFGDVLEPSSLPPAQGVAPPLRRTLRLDSSFLDMLLPPAGMRPGVATPGSTVQRFREGDDPSLLRTDYDVVVVDDEAATGDAVIAAVDSLGTLTHYVGVESGQDEGFALVRPHRQRDVVLANVVSGNERAPAWVGSPRGAGVVVRALDPDRVPDLHRACADLAAALRQAGYDAQGWSEDAGGAESLRRPADIAVVSGDEIGPDAVRRACAVAGDGVVVLCRSCAWSPPALAQGGDTGALPDGWRVVVEAAEGRIVVRNGKSAVIAREPAWNDPNAENVVDRVERLRGLGWRPIVDWTGRPRSDGELARLLAETAVAPDPRMILLMRGHDLTQVTVHG